MNDGIFVGAARDKGADLTTEQGIVVSVTGASARVKTNKTGACEGCSAKGYCNTLGGGKEMEVEALNPVHAKEGDRVLIGFETASLLKGAFLLYVFPILGLLAGGLLGEKLSVFIPMDASLCAAVFAFGFFGLFFVFVRRKGNELGRRTAYRPKVVRVL